MTESEMGEKVFGSFSYCANMFNYTLPSGRPSKINKYINFWLANTFEKR